MVRANVSKAQLILLDEPMAVLNDGESDRIEQFLVEMKKSIFSFCGARYGNRYGHCGSNYCD